MLPLPEPRGAAKGCGSAESFRPPAGPLLTTAGAASSYTHPQLGPHPRGQDPCVGPPQYEVLLARTPRQVHGLTHYGGPAQDPSADITPPMPLDLQPFLDQQAPPSAQTASRDDCRLPPRAPPLRCQDAPSPETKDGSLNQSEFRNGRDARTDRLLNQSSREAGGGVAPFLEPRPVCASATAKEAKETFPEFLRAP